MKNNTRYIIVNINNACYRGVVRLSPKAFKKSVVVQAGLELVMEKGLQELSARKIAERLNASTAPVYSCFASMETLTQAVLNEAQRLLVSFTNESYTKITFLNIGVGIVRFADKHPNLYRALFMETPSVDSSFTRNQFTWRISSPVVEHFLALMKQEVDKDESLNPLKPVRREDILIKMWVYTHGLASLICNGQLKLPTIQETIENLFSVGGALIEQALRECGLPIGDTPDCEINPEKVE